MINILITVLLVAAVKLGFLRVFAPRHGRDQHAAKSLPFIEERSRSSGKAMMEKITTYRSAPHAVLKRLAHAFGKCLACALAMAKLFTGGR